MTRFSERRYMWAFVFSLVLSTPQLLCASQEESQPGIELRSNRDTCVVEADEQPSDAVRVEDIIGAFDVVLHVTENVQRDSLVRGRMTLKPWPPPEVDTDSVTVSWQVWGWTTIPPDRIGDIHLSGPVSSDDPTRPGVHGNRYLESSIILVLDATTPYGAVTFDGGIGMHVLASQVDGFRGTWSAGNPGPAPAGYFCAWRAGGENDS